MGSGPAGGSIHASPEPEGGEKWGWETVIPGPPHPGTGLRILS